MTKSNEKASMGKNLVVALVEYFFVTMCGVDDGFDGRVIWKKIVSETMEVEDGGINKVGGYLQWMGGCLLVYWWNGRKRTQPRIERDYQKGEERERECVCDTNIRPKIHGLKHLDSQILLHLPDHFHGVVEREMGILFFARKGKSASSLPASFMEFPLSESNMFPLSPPPPTLFTLSTSQHFLRTAPRNQIIKRRGERDDNEPGSRRS